MPGAPLLLPPWKVIAPPLRLTTLAPVPPPVLKRRSVLVFRFRAPPLTFSVPRALSNWFTISQRLMVVATLTVAPVLMVKTPCASAAPRWATTRSASMFTTPAPETVQAPSPTSALVLLRASRRMLPTLTVPPVWLTAPSPLLPTQNWPAAAMVPDCRLSVPEEPAPTPRAMEALPWPEKFWVELAVIAPVVLMFAVPTPPLA